MKSLARMTIRALRWKPACPKCLHRVFVGRRAVIAAATLLPAACVLFFFSGGAQGKIDSGNISVTLEPKQVQLGEGAILAIQVSGEAAEQPVVTGVSGLRFFPLGQSSEYRSINGLVSASTSYLFQIQAQYPGEFTIPPVEMSINGRVQKSESMTLKVAGGGGLHSRGGALPPPAMSRQGGGNTVFPSGRGNSTEETAPAFLRVIPRKALSYVGELVPIEIRAYFRQGMQATLNSLPVLSGSAFAFQDPDKKPQQTEEVVDGIGYTVLTWYTAVAAVKEGEHRVDAELNATILLPERGRRNRSPFGRGLFDDDFFNGAFAGGREEHVTLKNPRLKIRILPLPKLGKPENFSGAVGHFMLSASATPKKSMVGDPITITMTIEGAGNFDRVSSPSLDISKGWKTYTPTTSFNAGDSAGYEGKKTFEQAIIPLDASMKEIPPVEFSYFDTKSEKYVTLKTNPIQVDIVPGAAYSKAVSNSPGPSGSQPTSNSSSVLQKGSVGLTPIHVGMGHVVADLRPIIKNPWFLGAQGIPIGALFLGLFFTRKQKKISGDPGMDRKKQVRRKVARSIKEMDRAMNENDVPGFFTACRCASQESLGEIWSISPESITLAEIRDRLSGRAEGIRHVFETADAVAYSGQSFSQEELRKCRDLVIGEMEKMGKGRQAENTL